MWRAMAVVIASSVAAHAARAQAAKDYTDADVHFMQGMIFHHAQAVQMCQLAPSHGASQKVALLCKKILISQREEIGLMQHWLEDRGLTAPKPATDTMVFHDTTEADMQGMHMMSGMLTAAQMHALDQSHDTSFDRLFLTGMIQHHTGAIDMVADLFKEPGAGQGADIFAFATDVDASQRAEIGRMLQLLNSLSGSD
jgi:uncharacterized protein (DUF305 family)